MTSPEGSFRHVNLLMAQGGILLLTSRQWAVEPAVRRCGLEVRTPELCTREIEATPSEKVSKKTQGKGEEHPHWHTCIPATVQYMCAI